MGLIQFNDIGSGLADQGNDEGLITASAFSERFSGEGFSGEDFVPALAIKMDFAGAALYLFDFNLKGLYLAQWLPVFHAVAPAEGILAKFTGKAMLNDITRGEGAPGLIFLTHDIPLWLSHLQTPLYRVAS